MTAEKYVKEVGKLLKCRASQKKKIKAELLEKINKEVGQGRSLEDVLSQLGIPWDYANRYNDNFDKAERNAARREKKLKILAAVAAVFAVLVLILYWYMPKWSDIGESAVFNGQQVKETAENIIRLYSDDEYEAVVEYMTDDMKKVLNAPTLQLSKGQLATADFGKLLAFGEMYASEAKQGSEFFAMVQVSVSYENTSIAYTLTFDEEMKLAGFYLK